MELQHRHPKSHYLRTSRKNFEKQLGSIERRQARIHRIRQKLNHRNKFAETLVHEKRPESPTSDYHIGKTQNHPVDLGVFFRENRLDPAVKVCLYAFVYFLDIYLIKFLFRISQET